MHWQKDIKLLFENTSILAKTTGFYNLARRGAIEILQHSNNVIRDDDGLRRIAKLVSKHVKQKWKL